MTPPTVPEALRKVLAHYESGMSTEGVERALDALLTAVRADARNRIVKALLVEVEKLPKGRPRFYAAHYADFIAALPEER